MLPRSVSVSAAGALRRPVRTVVGVAVYLALGRQLTCGFVTCSDTPVQRHTRPLCRWVGPMASDADLWLKPTINNTDLGVHG